MEEEELFEPILECLVDHGKATLGTLPVLFKFLCPVSAVSVC